MTSITRQVRQLEDKLAEAHRQLEHQQAEWTTILADNHSRQRDLSESLWYAQKIKGPT